MITDSVPADRGGLPDHVRKAHGERIVIGVPRSLFFYSYFPFWEMFFTELGAKVLVSDRTDRKILRDGQNSSSNELCLPIKLLYGHILNLRGRCDFVFLPYIISTQKGFYYCPKLIATPDLVKANIAGAALLSADVDIENFYRSLYVDLKEIASKVAANPIRIYAAYRRARAHQALFERHVQRGLLFDEALSAIRGEDRPGKVAGGHFAGGRPAVAVIGHTYLFNDPHISFDLLGRLRKGGASVLTSDALSARRINRILSGIESRTHWSFGNRIIASAIHFSRRKDVAGIVYVTPFGCSSDSLIREYIDANIARKKPMLTLTVDEHSGDAGIATRIEAFFDMIARNAAHGR